MDLKLRSTAPALVPGVLALAVFLAWAAVSGGFPPTALYPGALFLLALAGVAAVAYPRALVGVPRLTLAAVALLGAFAAWSFFSIIWADVRGDAWDGANRTLLYVTVYLVFALLPWTAEAAAAYLTLFSLGTAAVGAIFWLRAVNGDDPAGLFVDGRYASPVGYINANCALFLIAFWPAIFLASRRAAPVVLRAAALAAGALLLELAILSQSRGSLIAFPLVLVLYLALVPGRIRAAFALLAVAAAAFAVRRPLLDVYAGLESGAAGPALREARDAIFLTVGIVFLVGAGIALVDRRLTLSRRSARATERIAAIAAALLAVALLGGVVAVFGNPVTRAERAWDEFTAGQPSEFGRSHFTGAGLGSNRYDFWRVALGEFKDAPVHGIGADNFAVAYTRERRSDEEPLYPHSLEIQVLSQTGVVGAVLFGGFLACALAAAWRGRSRVDAPTATVAAVSIVSFGYWFVHGSVDWFWEFPALTGPALAFLGIAAALGRRERSVSDARRKRARVRAAGAAVALLAGAAAAVSFTLPWLAARDVAQAARGWRSDPATAFERLDRASTLNVLSDRPLVIAGAIAMRLDDRPRARKAFGEALARNPNNWYSHLELAILDALAGRREAALQALRRARELNPDEPAVDLVRDRLRAGEPVSPHAVDRMFLQRLEARTS